MNFDNNRNKSQILTNISSFTDILFAVIMGFVLIKAINIIEITPLIERLKAIFIYCFILIYMFNFWLAAKIETNLINEYTPQSFSFLEGFFGGTFGIIVVGLTYYMVHLIIIGNLKQVFLFFLIFDIFLFISNLFIYFRSNKLEKSKLKEFYNNKVRILIYLLLLISMTGIFLLAKEGFIWVAIIGVYIVTLVSEIFIYNLRNNTIYKLIGT